MNGGNCLVDWSGLVLKVARETFSDIEKCLSVSLLQLVRVI